MTACGIWDESDYGSPREEVRMFVCELSILKLKHNFIRCSLSRHHSKASKPELNFMLLQCRSASESLSLLQNNIQRNGARSCLNLSCYLHLRAWTYCRWVLMLVTVTCRTVPRYPSWSPCVSTLILLWLHDFTSKYGIMSSEMVQLHGTSSGHEKKPGGIRNDLNVVDSSPEVQGSFFGPPAFSSIRCRMCEARQIAAYRSLNTAFCWDEKHGTCMNLYFLMVGPCQPFYVFVNTGGCLDCSCRTIHLPLLWQNRP